MRRDAVRKRAIDNREKSRLAREVDVEYARRVIARARVDASRLTRSALWNVYLEQLEALNEVDCKELEALQAELESPNYRSAEEAQKTQFACQILLAQIKARNECIALPQRILQGTTGASD
jgi:hypothetical protein